MKPFCLRLNKLLWYFLFLSGAVISYTAKAQDTINWRSDYKLKWQDFQGQPDTTVRALAVCASEISYQYKVVNNKLVFSIDCFFDKKKSWIKYNLKTILNHEQGHFDISKLFALKLEQKFKSYKLNISTVQQDLLLLYNQTIEDRTYMHNRYDEETKSTLNDSLQKKFIQDIRKQIVDINKNLGYK